MKNFKSLSLILFASLSFALMSCGGSKNTTATDMSGEGSMNVYNAEQESKIEAANSKTTAQSSVEIKNSNLSLADYLRRLPGVQVSGNGSDATVMIRGGSSMSGDNSPLYVIDGSQVGKSYAQAESMVDPNDIKSVNVLKDASATSAYGMQGSSGVIVIKTKAAAAARKKRKKN